MLGTAARGELAAAAAVMKGLLFAVVLAPVHIVVFKKNRENVNGHTLLS